MVMEEHGGGCGFPARWGVVAKPCDSCEATAALLFCRVDSAFLCMGCDAKLHNRAGNARHERVWMCEVCEQAPAAVTCKADAAALCVACDRDIHSANPLARRHERIPVVPFFDTAEAVVKSAAFHGPGGDEISDFTNDNTSRSFLDDAETTEPSWVLPIPAAKLAADPPDMKSIEFLFSDSDQFLDLEYPVPIHSSRTDSVVPVQPIKSLQAMTPQMMNQPSNNYVEIDFTASKFNSYNNNSSFTPQSLSQSISSSSMEVGVVPDGSSMSESTYPFGRTAASSVDLSGGPANALPSQGTDREARVLRYREKRKNRKFEKTIRYASRKAYAETRPRIKGRFAKRVDVEPEDAMMDRIFSSGSSAFTVEATGYGVVPSF
ncbi:zinc finger protein CONSTANS-LIKE 5 [Diospyros lotus]|uniref:zinc finger protein CONSTANS-LIKE 5 n=1 Tax=Diospyros lotus TaxID=55363 RepID=UPI0022582932|nr:zinc finger protein CONSTANS-LIKE 5 [Diospyros lotus]